MKSSRLRAGLIQFQLFTLLALPVFAQPAAEPQVRGIVCTGDRTQALLDLKGTSRLPSTVILQRGESIYGYEVMAIDEKTCLVTLRETANGRVIDLKLVLAPGEDLAKRTLLFQSAR